ncbi:class I SAM-dependent rRNA methyltransferase [Portibacter marinus]|uniref:class I SAM-dependent rRNA methyltransferase n=1 Tax=Portibacter marinus TaxID=2898660 RepID=UPI001F2F79A6|nr:class I SAM-dependent rRNA methyltransferase [Portibacter marinus]
MNKIAFKVKRAAEKSILQGHPWIYESSIVKQNKEGKAGDLAVIFDQRNNELLALGLYDPASVIRIRVLHVGGSQTLNYSFFANLFKLAYDQRRPLLETKTTAYRLIYGENDGLSGLIVDIYNSIAVIKLYTEVWFGFMSIFTEILQQEYDIDTIILRLNRKLQQQKIPLQDGELILGQLPSEEVIFYEHGLRFKANLIKGHKTGYFLDHRHNRLKVRNLAKGKDVLDIFSYAGGFSVNAVAGGAKQVISVDISEQALEIARMNMALNFEEANHRIMVIDAFEAIVQLKAGGKNFDLIIVDPPSFAKSSEQIPRAYKSYRRLVKEVLPLVKENGIFLMCSCSSRIPKDEFFDVVIAEVVQSGRQYQILETTDHDVDHPKNIAELNYLKSIYIQLQN